MNNFLEEEDLSKDIAATPKLREWAVPTSIYRGSPCYIKRCLYQVKALSVF